ncbi:MAG: hypothetical protein FJ088_11715 [Deltaproteobacteria bacterium]|nr:hypothetical protein [Deltaproteobacteria bacterium]
MRKELKGKPALYRKASIAGGAAFILLAMTLPIYMDYLRNPPVEIPSAETATKETARTEAGKKLQIKSEVDKKVLENIRKEAKQKTENNVCSNWVFGRCDALGIPQNMCAGFMEEALKVPLKSGIPGCKEVFEERLAEASKKAVEAAAEEQIPALPDKTALSMEAASYEYKTKKSEETAAQKTEKKEITPEEKKSALEKLYKLVEETQTASWNYGTIKSEQERRLYEMKEIVEKLEDPKYNKLYESVSSQASRFSGYSPKPIQLETTEDSVKPVEGTAVGDADMDKLSSSPPTDELGLIKSDIEKIK